MCVILYKPTGCNLPSLDTLRQCWNTNPDGAGFMYPMYSQVQIYKGFMSWETFADTLDNLRHIIDIHSTPLAIHFRIATHGEVSPGCCHPFPISNNPKTLQATSQTSDIGFMHNGVLHGLSTSKNISDTMAYDKRVIYPLARLAHNLLDNELVRSVIDNTAQDSRFLFMNGEGQVHLFGRWIALNGILYSNENFRIPKSINLYNDWGNFGAYEQTSLFDEF